MKLADLALDIRVAMVDRDAEGYWCLHCETCTRIGDIEVYPMHDHYDGKRWHGARCPHCDATPLDFFEISGDFQTGEVVSMYGEDARFNELRDPVVVPVRKVPGTWSEVRSFGGRVSVDGGPWEAYWCNVDTGSQRRVSRQAVAYAIKQDVALGRTLGDVTRIRVKWTWFKAEPYVVDEGGSTDVAPGNS